MREYVVDASVIVKWFVREKDSDRAVALRDGHVNGELVLSAPSLAVFEALNALKYSGLYSESEMAEIASAVDGYGLALYNLRGKAAALAIETAFRNDVTMYDASYIGLAIDLGAKFVTADRKLVESVGPSHAKVCQLLDRTA